MMLRERLTQKLKDAMLSKDSCATATIRLVLAALKDRDIAARSKERTEGLDDGEILALLQTMLKQRRESIAMYEKGKRPDLAEREAREIEVIRQFLPEQMDEASTAEAVDGVVAELEADGLKDMGRVMGALRARYTGRMDFSRASALAKESLS